MIVGDEFLLKVEELSYFLEEFEAVFQWVILLVHLRACIECLQEVQQIEPLSALRYLPGVHDDHVEDLEEAPLKLDRQPQHLVIADDFLIERIDLGGTLGSILAQRIIAGVNVLEQLVIVLVSIVASGVFLLLAADEFVSHGALDFRNLD